MSKGFKLSQGLPQGSVLSPTLFTLFMCGIEEVISRRCEKLERVQLSAACILTGLRNSCPRDIVLFEAYLQPLSVRRNSILVKYYNKLLSYNPRNRTSKFLNNLSNNQRLKRNSPYSQVISDNMNFPSVKRHHLSSYIDPSEGFPEVFFHRNLSAHINKTSDPPEFLKKLALEVISNIPDDALLIYTDGSRNEQSHSGSGIYIKSQNYSSHIKLRNSDGCSVFRSELITIDTGLKEALSTPGSNCIWILSGNRSAIQHLSKWHKVGDNTGVAILEKLKHLSSLLDRSLYNGFLRTLTSRAMRLLTL
ncbi:uncharacterized protein TNCV_1624311 [Trichonephila clavipes]|nr:uncharacterized protein TNCV_1624311 [Trichonephila clavipes]